LDINKKRSYWIDNQQGPGLYLALGRGIDGCFFSFVFGDPELIFLLFDKLKHPVSALNLVRDCRFRSWKQGLGKYCGSFASDSKSQKDRML